MKDHRAAASLEASYEFYFGQRRPPFAQRWLAVNAALHDEGGESLPGYYRGRSWWLEGLTVDQAVKRHLEPAQEER
jgi:hypothetical protein